MGGAPPSAGVARLFGAAFRVPPRALLRFGRLVAIVLEIIYRVRGERYQQHCFCEALTGSGDFSNLA